MPLLPLREPSSTIDASGHELSSVGAWIVATGVMHSSTAVVLRTSHGKYASTCRSDVAAVLHLDPAPLQLPNQPAGHRMPGWKRTLMPAAAKVSEVRYATTVIGEVHMQSGALPVAWRVLVVGASNSNAQLTRPEKPAWLVSCASNVITRVVPSAEK
eukprot:7383291-Prymnesium_polylepis.3